MEAIAALALACNVVQFVELGLKTASKCREIYNKGSTAEYQDLEYTSKKLAEITENLNASIQNARTNKPLTNDDHELQRLAQRCTERANDLLEELDILKTPSRHGKRAALLKTLQSMRKSNEIKRISDKLREDERVLNTRLLSRLSERVDLLAVQQDDSFNTLDQSVQNFVNNLASGYNKLSDLISQESTTTRSTITQEHRDTRYHVTSNFQNMQLNHENAQTAQYYAKFLASLYYPEMKERQETISDAHQQTFTWIFDRMGEGIRPWDDFVSWLEKSDGIYWIQGKPGAGKSTLMNYISADPRTTDSLNVWGKPSQVLILTFFFWNPGTKLQKSSLGLLRSLLYQILDHQQGIIPELIKLQGKATVDGPMPTWTRKRVESSLKFVIDRISFPLCLFIDGLDELDEGEEDLLQLISDFQNRPSVKICASSRPSSRFKNAFKHSAQLKLQDLTRRDIEIYVTDRLHKNPEMAILLQGDSWHGNLLIGHVIAKANGVFLWVELAVKILLKGLTNKDDWDMMMKQVDLLPQDIESLYTHMWNRLGDDKKLYHESAAQCFRLISLQEISLLQFAVATNENLQATLLYFKSPPPATEDVISMCEDALFRVQARCAGFLEVDGFNDHTSTGASFLELSASEKNESEGTNSYEDGLDKAELEEENSNEYATDDEGLPEGRTRKVELGDHGPDEANDDKAEEEPRLRQMHNRTNVRFIHRTTYDFLLETKDGQAILGDNPPLASSPRILLCKSLLGLGRLLSESSSWLQSVLKVVKNAQTAESGALDSLMNIIEGYFGAKYSSSFTHPNWYENYISKWSSDPDDSDPDPWDSGPAKDLLALAAFQGIHLDLWKRFSYHIKGAGLDYTRYLLSCALTNKIFGFRPELVLILLTNVADPNKLLAAYDGSPVSYWSRYLGAMWFKRNTFRREWSSAEVLHEIIKAFLNSGIDLHETTQIIYVIEDFLSYSSGGKMKKTVQLQCELSARYIVAELLRHDTRFSKIEEHFENAGAKSTRRLLSADCPRRESWNLHDPVSELDFQRLSEALGEMLGAVYTGVDQVLPPGRWMIRVSGELKGILD